MTVPSFPTTIGDYTELLQDGAPFTLNNIGGDGEMLTIVGWMGVNSDGYLSTPEKAEELSRVILEPRATFHGYNPGKNGSKKLLDAERWLRGHGVNVPSKDASFLYDPDYGSSAVNVRWAHKEIIGSANVHGRLNPFLRALRECPLLVVGASWLTESFMDVLLADHVLRFDPETEGWSVRFSIEAQVREVLSAMPDDTVVTWSLGYLTKVLMWRLAPAFPTVTQIDVGACWDPYCGVRNRHGYKADTWPDAMQANLEGLV